MGVQQPYMYNVDPANDARFPATTFDPKAITRASWEPTPRKPKPQGPLISFNRHPDAHEVLSHRSTNYPSMSLRSKRLIKGLRHVQLGLRSLELIGALGILVLMILITKVDNVTGWVLRITSGVVAGHCIYAIYHLSRHAARRTPGSSAAYQIFAAVSDLCVLPLYTYGALNTNKKSEGWATRLSDQTLMDYFVPAVFYTIIGAGGLHVFSLAISSSLSYMFRKICLLPPDMNPLEDHLTSRPMHKRNKSSLATLDTESEKRLSTPLEKHRRSGLAYEDLSRPPTVPFMHTRTRSNTSSSSRGSRVELPSRQYQIVPGNSPRNSATSTELKRMSTPRSAHRGSYAELPLLEPKSSRPGTASNRMSGPVRSRFIESWPLPDSPASTASKTQQRNREMDAAKTRAQNRGGKSYEALSQRYNAEDSDESDYDDENNLAGSDLETDVASDLHPNPLRSNPATPPQTAPRAKTPLSPLRNSGLSGAKALSELSSNERRVSGSRDIADEKPSHAMGSPWKRNRDSSIQLESDFYSRPYAELKPAVPPVMVGANRKVSSGNDYDSKRSSAAYERRNVSGKIAEEGRARDSSYRTSRYSILNI